MQKKITIIGSGISGIASAVLLSKEGYRVEVYEKNSSPGGKISEIRNKGYRFDTGPSLFTLPELVMNLIGRDKADQNNKFQYFKLDNICRYFYEDGTIINSFADKVRFAKEAKEKTGEKEENIMQYLHTARELYDLTADVFLFSSFHKIRNFTKDAYKNTALHLHKLDALTTLHNRNKRSFTHPHLVQLFDRYATYNGSNPYKVPATLKVVAHLEHNLGAYFPAKGMYNIVETLTEEAQRNGVEFYYHSPVEEIIVDKHEIKGIKVNDSFVQSDIVISAGDVFNTYKKLLRNFSVPWNIKKSEPSSSALIFYWGIKKNFYELDLHNILFSNNYKSEFDHIFSKGHVYDDPTVYIFISSRIVTSDAPDGCENWFVMINAPHNRGQNWDEMIKKVRSDIIRKINRMLQTDITRYIVTEHVNDPRSIEFNTSSHLGALYGISSNSKLSAFLRHANFSRRIKGLFFTGGSVHPGGGIPLCISSANIVANEINMK